MAPSLGDGSSLFNLLVLDGHGLKGLVDTGLVKVPDQYVQPPQERKDKSKACLHGQSPIDLSGLAGPDRGKVVEAIAAVAETVRFLQVVNHGVPVELLESLKDAAHRFHGEPPDKDAIYRQGMSLLVTYGTSFAPEKEKALEWKDYVSMVYTSDAHAVQHWPNHCK